MPSNKLESKYIDATKYEIRALWTGVGVGHMSEDVDVVTVGYPFEPPDDLGGWFLADYMADKENTDRFFTLWVREKLKPKAAPRAKKRKPGAPAPDIQKVIDETQAAVTPQAVPKKKRGRPKKETEDLPPPVANLPEYNGN